MRLEKFREFNESGKRISDVNMGSEMVSEADRINKILESLDIDENLGNNKEKSKEINREAIYGIDQEWIRKEEPREVKIKYNSNPQPLNSNTNMDNEMETETNRTNKILESTDTTETLENEFGLNLDEVLANIYGENQAINKKEEPTDIETKYDTQSTNIENNNLLAEEYSLTIKNLALQKIRNELLFEVFLNNAIQKLNLKGMNLTREQVLLDVEIEIFNTKMNSEEDTMHR